MTLITDPDFVSDSLSDDGSTEAFINITNRTIKLNVIGNLSTDGITEKALYSFLKEQWRNDSFTKNLAAFPFPMTPITDESFELVDGWDFANDTTRYLIRTGGWTVRNTSGNITQKWCGIIGLGTVNPTNQLYFEQYTSGATNFQLMGQVNQAVQIFSNSNGDAIYDFDRRGSFKLFVREYAQTYDNANLDDIGVTLMDSIAYRFPIGTGTDLKITHADSIVSSTYPYTEINVRYFTGSFKRDIDTTNLARSFGIVIDAGTHSGVDGAFTSGSSILTSVAAGISGSNFTGGTLRIHSGSAKGLYNIASINPNRNAVTISTAFPATQTSASFTLYKSASINANAEQIYEKVQYLLRQNTNINSVATGSVSVIGKTADLLLRFVGDTLEAGTMSPINPASGSANGVVIEGVIATDNNRVVFQDGGGTTRTYPYVAVLTLQFGANLIADTNAKYWIYFTTLPGANDDFGQTGAVLVNDNSGVPMSGSIGGNSSIALTFNYDGNTQGGRTAATDAGVTAVAIGLSTGQYVRATGTITRSIANTISLVAALERNYLNV